MGPVPTNAISMAAKMAIKGILPLRLSNRENPQNVGIFIEPLYGFSRNREAVTAVGPAMINDITHRIKGAAISKRKTEAVRKLFKGAFYDRSVTFPPR